MWRGEKKVDALQFPLDDERLVGDTRVYTIFCLLLQFYQVRTYIPGRIDFLNSLISHARRADTTCLVQLLYGQAWALRKSNSSWRVNETGEKRWPHRAIEANVRGRQGDRNLVVWLQMAWVSVPQSVERKQYDTRPISVRTAESGEKVNTRNYCGK